MPQLKLKRGTSANLNNVSVADGQLIITTDTKEIYLDNDTSRIKLAAPPLITSVNGKTGAVSLNYSDVGAPSTTGTNASGTWGINISGNAATANYLNVVASNEIRFNNFNYNSLWFNYLPPGDTTNSTACTAYYFGDGQRQYSTVTLHAGQFSGNAATASKLATARTISITGSVTGSGSFDGSGNLSIATTTNHTHDYAAASHTHNYAGSSSSGGAANSANILNINNTASLSSCLQYIQTADQTSGNDLPTASWWHVLKMNHGTGDTYYKRLLAFNFFNHEIRTSYAAGNGAVNAWKKVWLEGDSVTGAVWNDYAEYRESDCEKFGYVLAEKGDDTLTKTTERLQPFAGISSDTWGFCQGETDKAKTPIAVAGRVLVYTYQDRNKYKPGDVVCAAPDGTIDIMTREEVINYPDRIVGTVSCVPDYEEWGGGEGADRDPVKVNGRIWIKVK